MTTNTPAPWEDDDAADRHTAAAVAELHAADPPPPVDDAALPAVIAEDARRAVLAWRDRDAVATFAADLRRRVLDEVRGIAAAAQANRRPGKPTAATVAPELELMADAYDALDAVSSAVAAGAKEARAVAGDLVLEVEPDRELGTATVRVGTKGGTLKVTRSQATKVSADADAIVDVLVASLLAELDGDPHRSEAAAAPVAYASGARDAVAAVLALMGPPSWKSTALDDLARRLEAREEYDLAIRLGHAYGRVASGNPSTKLERAHDENTTATTRKD